MARTDVEPVEFYVPIGLRAEIRKHAKSLDLSVSEYVRRLVEKDMGENNGGIDLSVGHGGDRRKSTPNS